jgi:hypothetical protein
MTTSFSSLVSVVILGFLLGLGGAVFFQILSGQINTKYLLYGRKRNGTRYLSPERVQLLLFTLWTAGNYLVSAAQSTHGLPDVSQDTLMLLGGSHAVYLGGKSYAMLFMKRQIDGQQEG